MSQISRRSMVIPSGIKSIKFSQVGTVLIAAFVIFIVLADVYSRMNPPADTVHAAPLPLSVTAPVDPQSSPFFGKVWKAHGVGQYDVSSAGSVVIALLNGRIVTGQVIPTGDNTALLRTDTDGDHHWTYEKRDSAGVETLLVKATSQDDMRAFERRREASQKYHIPLMDGDGVPSRSLLFERIR